MSKYTFKVKITKYIEIEIKDELFTPNFMKESEKFMHGFTTIKEHAEHIAQFFARFNDTDGMDGYCGMEDAFDVLEIREDVDVDEMDVSE